MKYIFLFSVVALFSTTVWSASLKVEGTCSGKLDDGSLITFQYFSDYDGCKKVSSAALTYYEGREGMITGQRSFTDSSDIYKFDGLRLVLANSTGNTSARYHYVDDQGTRRVVTLSCDVRDYEYAECQ